MDFELSLNDLSERATTVKNIPVANGILCSDSDIEVQMRLFKIGAVSTIIDCHASTIRDWEKRGVIPKPFGFTGSGHRLYTLNQVRILKKLSETTKVMSLRQKKSKYMDSLVEGVHNDWLKV